MTRLLIILPLLLVTACATSPLYVAKQNGTIGEIPRDGRGEPMWDAISQPAPPPALPQVSAPGLAMTTPPAR